jgi:serpin B
MKLNRLFSGIGICLLLAVSGCKTQKKATDTGDPANGYDMAGLSEANNRFAMDLYRQISEGSGNLIFSPYSISTVLNMVYSGAGGITAVQMSEVLYLPGAEKVDPASKELRNTILANDTLSGLEISLANAIWAQHGFYFRDDYMDKLKESYEAPLTLLDFINDANREDGRRQINSWVEENTRQKIRDLIAPGVLDASTRMVLTNAIYFNGNWHWSFDESLTSPALFHVDPDESIQADFMHQTRSVPYYEDNEIQAIQLPYKHRRLTMMIILPRSVDGWKMISRILDHESLGKLESHFQPREVRISLPKFTTEWKLNLGKELSGMGMDQLFGLKADLSGMTGEKNLFVDEVVHQAFIEVSESGTEAAAATAAVISLKSSLGSGPVQFRADHPFIYLIKDNQTGCLLFVGRLVNPI